MKELEKLNHRKVEYNAYVIVTEVLEKLIQQGRAELVAEQGKDYTFPIHIGYEREKDKFGRSTGEVVPGSEKLLVQYFTVKMNGRKLHLTVPNFHMFEGLQILNKSDKHQYTTINRKCDYDLDDIELSISMIYDDMLIAAGLKKEGEK